MAKDPALLFYTNDFLAGTYTMSDEQVGKYIRLLCLQHQKYELTKKDMMNICKTYDKDIFEKFKLENGVYYNVRLREEAERRKAYSESRRKNRGSEKTYVEHMETVTETVTKTDNKRFTPPLLQDVKDFFKAKGYTEQSAIRAFNHYDLANWHDTGGKPVKNWKQKMNTVWFKPENKIPAEENPNWK